MPAVAHPETYRSVGEVIAAGRFRLPSWVPAKNTISTLIEANTFRSVNPGAAPGLNGWDRNASGVLIGGMSYIFDGTIDAFSGGVFNPWLGSKGSIHYCGGGHSVSNGCWIITYDIADKTYTLTIGGSTNCYPVSVVNGEYADGSPVSIHSYDLLSVIGPESGYPLGALVIPFANGGTVEANVTCSASHLFDFANQGDGWIRFAENNTGILATDASCSAYDPDLNRVWWLRAGNNLPTTSFLDITAKAQAAIGITNKIPSSDTNSLSLRYDRERKLLIHTNSPTDRSVRRVYYMDTTSAGTGFRQATLSAALPTPSAGLGFSFDRIPDGSYLCNAQGRIFRLVVPASLTNMWEVTEITYSGDELNQTYMHGKRWSYADSVECFMWKAESGDAHQAYRV